LYADAMCRRYALPDSLAVEREFLPAAVWWKFEPHSNIAPGRYLPAIRIHDKASEGVMMRWGLIPGWAEGEINRKPAVADIAKLERSKFFRTPWLEGQRCILPMAGFYVWELTAANYRQPYFVYLRDRGVFGVAGIWDRSEYDRDDVIESFSIVSVPANELLLSADEKQRAEGKQHTMPAILRRRDYEVWLNGTPAQAKAALHSFRANWMLRHPVSPRINSPQADHPELHAPAEGVA
jgi:putative SOS response-associated peptidase YedK